MHKASIPLFRSSIKASFTVDWRAFYCFAYVFLLVSLLPISQAVGSPTDEVQTIKRQSQEFSDACANGDAKTLAKYLDEDVVFMEESGEIDTKQDIVSSAKPPTNGISNRLIQSDLMIKLHGDVAVTSFTDNATTIVYGQKSTSRFRSTEVWQNKNGFWKMISSQTLALPEDPPALTLPPEGLDQYVGMYTAGAKLRVKIERQDKSLFTMTNGGKPSALLVEAPDVLFVPGQPRQRRIFKHDPAGKIVGFSTRRDGHDLLQFTRQS